MEKVYSHHTFHNRSTDKKLALISGILALSILAAGLYGILHDQVTYTISPEYFTRFKYNRFGLNPAWFGGDRPTVALIGFPATWWTGIFIGAGLGLSVLMIEDRAVRSRALRKAFGIILCVTVVMGLAGFIFDRLILTQTDVDWILPAGLVDREAFITVGAIHNFSYAGGLFGLIAAMWYLLRLRRRARLRPAEEKRILVPGRGVE